MSDKWLTTSEISERWGVYDSTIRMAIKNGRLQEGEYKKSGYGAHGGVWLIREDAVRRLWGRPKLSQADIDEIEAILGVKNLGIDYNSFKSGDELADWLDGRRFPEFDEPMSVSEEQRAALREIYEEVM